MRRGLRLFSRGGRRKMSVVCARGAMSCGFGGIALLFTVVGGGGNVVGLLRQKRS